MQSLESIKGFCTMRFIIKSGMQSYMSVCMAYTRTSLPIKAINAHVAVATLHVYPPMHIFDCTTYDGSVQP